MDNEDEFENFLNRDSLYEAELITGKAYDEDESTRAMGLIDFFAHNEVKREELALRDDSYHRMSYSAYCRILLDLNFELVFSERFDSASGETDEDVFELYWRNGVLILCGSYGKNLNSSLAYFNCEFEESHHAFKHRLSGHLHGESYDERRYVWVGNFDAREAVRHRFGTMERHGRFLTQWVEAPRLFLLNYAEHRSGLDLHEVNSVKLGQLPLAVQCAMGV